MFAEIFRRYKSMKKLYPNKSREDLLWEIINSPAPSFYISTEGVRKILVCIRSYGGKRIYEH